MIKKYGSRAYIARKLVSSVGKHVYKYGQKKISDFFKRKGNTSTKRKSVFRTKKHYKRVKYSTETEEADSQHNDLSCHTVKNYLKRGRLNRRKTAGLFKFIQNKQYFKAGVDGQQLTMEGYAINYVTDYSNLTGSTALQDNEIAIDPFQMNPYSQTVGNNLYTSTKIVPNSSLLGLVKVKHELTVLNMCTAPCTVRIYWMLAKKDSNLGPEGRWSAQLTDLGTGQGLTAHSTRAPLSVGTAGAGAMEITDYGADPFQVKTFKPFYKSIAYKQIVLQGGDQKKIKTEFDFNKYVSREVFANLATSSLTVAKGYTIIPLLICRGGVIGYGVGTEISELGYSRPRIGLVQRDEYVYQGIPLSGSTALMTSFGTANINPTTTVAEKIINDVDQATTVQAVYNNN